MSERYDKTKKQNEEVSEKSAKEAAEPNKDNLIMALVLPYENVYAVNMDTGEGVCYRMGQVMSDRYGQKFAAGSYEQNICSYIENDVLEEDRCLFDKVCSVPEVRKLLADKSTYYFNYRVFRNDRIQYFQCQLVKPSRERNEFVIAFKDIDEEKKQELAQQKKIEEALAAVEKSNEALQEEMEIANALTRDCPDAALVNLEDGCTVTLKLHGKMIAGDKRTSKRPYQDTWKFYIAKYVLAEDREMLAEAVSIDTVRKALEEKDEYICSYRIDLGKDGIHHYQAVFLRIYSQRTEQSRIILGFRNVDVAVECPGGKDCGNE